MTARQKPQPKPVVVPLRQLRQALTQVLPFASDDAGISPINVVQLQSDGEVLTLTATDRYVIGRAKVRLDIEQGLVPFEPFSMRLDDARRLLAIFRVNRSIPNQAVELIPGSAWEVSDETVTLRGQAEPMGFPPIEKIFKTALDQARGEQPSGGPRGWDAKYIARFSLVREPHTPVVFWPAPPLRPVLVTVADWFYGVIMPVRVQADMGQLDLIEAELGAPAATPAAEAAEAPKPARRRRTKDAA